MSIATYQAEPIGADMSAPANMISRWAIVLAGGNGSRMSPAIQRWLGEDRPKQYCAFVGSRTMLQHTIDRLATIVPPEHIVVVIRSDQRRFFDEAVKPGAAGKVIEQPGDCGTMPAVYAAAAHILVQDPHATVLLTPSDLFVHSEERFAGYLEHICRLADAYSNHAFLLGASLERPESDYGWIIPGAAINIWGCQPPKPIPLTVRGFREKPPAAEAAHLFESGCLGNTLTMAVKANSLWQWGWRIAPNVMRRFESYWMLLRAIHNSGLNREHEAIGLAHLYHDLERLDFSKDILEKAYPWCSVVALEQVEWRDWGMPERLKESLERLPQPSMIPIEFLEASESCPASQTGSREARCPNSRHKHFPVGMMSERSMPKLQRNRSEMLCQPSLAMIQGAGGMQGAESIHSKVA